MTQDTSPYQTPQSSIDDSNAPVQDIVPASRKLRLLNFVIDQCIFMVFAGFVGVMTVVLFGDAGLDFLETLPDIVLGATLLIVYYFMFEVLTSKSPAKFITGTKVIDEKGNSPSASQVLGRALCRLIPFEFVSFFEAPCRGWHDEFSRTYVVKSR